MDRVAQLERTMTAFQENLDQLKRRGGEAGNQSDTSTIDLIQNLFSLFRGQVMGELSNIKAQIQAQGEHLDRLETYSRRNCILVHGIPEDQAKTEQECLQAATSLFNTKLRVNIATNQLDRAHRLGPPRSGSSPRPRPIIVKFRAYFDKKAVYSSKKALKGDACTITESLTRTRITILKRAREHFHLSRVWTSDGKIVVKVDGQERLATLSTHRELEALIAAHPSPAAIGQTTTRPSSSTQLDPSQLSNITHRR